MKPNTILIVDDQPFIRHVLTADLKSKGFEVEIAENGAEGLKIAAAIKPDLILMDIMMPVMDGFEACRKLRTIPGIKHTPVIFLSANAQQSALIKAENAGGNDYAVKSPDSTLLLEKITKAIKVKKNKVS